MQSSHRLAKHRACQDKTMVKQLRKSDLLQAQKGKALQILLLLAQRQRGTEVPRSPHSVGLGLRAGSVIFECAGGARPQHAVQPLALSAAHHLRTPASKLNAVSNSKEKPRSRNLSSKRRSTQRTNKKHNANHFTCVLSCMSSKRWLEAGWPSVHLGPVLPAAHGAIQPRTAC